MSKTSASIFLAIGLVLIISFGISAQKFEPCSGERIDVLNNDICGAKKWITVDDSVTICQILCLQDADPEKCGINPSWIGGKVYADEGAEYGFNFEPESVRIAEITAEAYQTTTCQIAENPKYYDGGTWYIPYDITEVQ
jgi:hypothetical protein